MGRFLLVAALLAAGCGGGSFRSTSDEASGDGSGGAAGGGAGGMLTAEPPGASGGATSAGGASSSGMGGSAAAGSNVDAGGVSSAGGSISNGGTMPIVGVGGSSGRRCDFISDCRTEPGDCAAALGASCGSSKQGSYACGQRQGFYSSDGFDAPCIYGPVGLDCSNAVKAMAAHCASLVAPGTGGSAGMGGAGGNASGGRGGAVGGMGGAACTDECTPNALQGCLFCCGPTNGCELNGCNRWIQMPCPAGSSCVSGSCK